MDYDTLPLITIDGSLTKDSVFTLLQSYAVYASDFILQELTEMLTGEYRLEGSISVLPNLLTSEHAINRLMYVQAFMIFDSKDGYYTNRKDLDSYELRYTLSGEGVLEYEGKKYLLKEGDGYFISCQKPHVYYSRPCGWKSTVLHINGNLCEDFFQSWSQRGNYKFDRDICPSFEMMQYQLLYATQKVYPYQEYRINCLLDLLLSELLSSTANMPNTAQSSNAEVITALLDHIHAHFSEELIFENLAKEFGISRTLLFNSFRCYTGFTPGRYLLQVRIKQAKILLKTSTLSIEDVATSVGFKDAGHFSQMFKKEVGVTPLKYRKA